VVSVRSIAAAVHDGADAGLRALAADLAEAMDACVDANIRLQLTRSLVTVLRDLEAFEIRRARLARLQAAQDAKLAPTAPTDASNDVSDLVAQRRRRLGRAQ
jgi:hypothetical protein